MSSVPWCGDAVLAVVADACIDDISWWFRLPNVFFPEEPQGFIVPDVRIHTGYIKQEKDPEPDPAVTATPMGFCSC